jgi:hypothetical protein
VETARSFQVIRETPDGRHTIDCAENEFIWDAAAGPALNYLLFVIKAGA